MSNSSTRWLVAFTVTLSALLGVTHTAHAEGNAKGSAQLTVSVQVVRSCLVGALDAHVSALPLGQARREAVRASVRGSLETSCRITDAPRIEVSEERILLGTERIEVQF